MNSYLLKNCPPLRHIVLAHFTSKLVQTLFYTSAFAAVALVFLPTENLMAQQLSFVRVLLVPPLVLLFIAFSSSFAKAVFVFMASFLTVPLDAAHYWTCCFGFAAFVYLIGPHAYRFNFVDYHFCSRGSVIMAALQKTFWRVLPLLGALYAVRWFLVLYDSLQELTILLDYGMFFLVTVEFTQHVYFALLYEPMRRIQDDPLKLAIISANLSCYLSHRADSNLRHYEAERQYAIAVKENKRQGKKTPPRQCQTSLLPTSHLDTFVLNQVICAIQKVIFQQDTLLGVYQLIQPAVQLAEKLRAQLVSESNQPILHIFEAPGALMNCLLFYFDFLQMCAQDALSRSFSEKNERTLIRLTQNNGKMQQIFAGDTAIQLNQIAQIQQQDNELEFEDEDNYGFGFDIQVDNNQVFNSVQKQQFQIDQSGRMKVKLGKFYFIKLFVLSPLTFEQLVNDPEAVSDYLEQKAKEKMFSKTVRQGRLIDVLTLKFLREEFEIKHSKTEDFLVLRSVVATINEIGFGLRGCQFYYLCKDVSMDLLKLIYQSLRKEGKIGDAIRYGCKVQACLGKE